MYEFLITVHVLAAVIWVGGLPAGEEQHERHDPEREKHGMHDRASSDRYDEQHDAENQEHEVMLAPIPGAPTALRPRVTGIRLCLTLL